MSAQDIPSLVPGGSADASLIAGKDYDLRLVLTAPKLIGFEVSTPVGPGLDCLFDREGFNRTKVSYRFGDGAEVLVPDTGRTLGDGKGVWSGQQTRVGPKITIKLTNVKPGLGVAAKIVVTGYAARDYNEALPPCTITVASASAQPPPELTSFVAEPVVCDANSKSILSWKVDRENDLDYLLALTLAPASAQQQFPAASSALPVNVNGTTGFTMKVVAKNDPSRTVGNERRLRVFAKGSSGFDSYKFEGGNIVGVYSDETAETPSLYALVGDKINTPEVTLWRSYNPFEPDAWQKLNTPPTSMNQARCPGIIWQRRLWLMGGDCCDPDFDRRSNSDAFDVVSCDLAFSVEGFIPRKPAGKETPWPRARMGHALVAPSDDRLWVIGGWRPNGGVLNDVWELDGREWKPQNDIGQLFKKEDGITPLPGCCMMSATATTTEIWVAGGFTTAPGGVANNAAMWVYKASNWTARRAPTPPEGFQFSACTLFTRDDRPFGIWVYVKPSETSFEYEYRLVALADGARSLNMTDAGAGELFLNAISYHWSSTVFSRSVFMRSLTQRDTPLNEKISYYYMLGGWSRS